MLLFFILITLIASVGANLAAISIPASFRIRKHNYPIETYKVHTEDGYILTLFRIPYSLKNKDSDKPRPVVFLMHSLMMSADVWVLSGPDSGLAFNLADAGFDVFMGNARGNRYGRKHAWLPATNRRFWEFSWFEIAMFDLKAMFFYVMHLTKQKQIHYIGHGEGSTCIMVLLSECPKFNRIITSVQMMSPMAFMKNAQSPILKVMTPVLRDPKVLYEMVGETDFVLSNEVVKMLSDIVCPFGTPLAECCANSLFLIVGFNPYTLNCSLLPAIWSTHPSGAGAAEFFHYLQLYNSGHFRMYDHGWWTNLIRYQQFTPPKFNLKKISAPMRLIFSSNDLMASPIDVLKLVEKLRSVDNVTRIEDLRFGHTDFVFSTKVKTTINEGLIDYIRRHC